jgi:hypothetical protein
MDDLNQLICERFKLVDSIKKEHPEFFEAIDYDNSKHTYFYAMSQTPEEAEDRYMNYFNRLPQEVQFSLDLFKGVLLGLDEDNYKDEDWKEIIENSYAFLDEYYVNWNNKQKE